MMNHQMARIGLSIKASLICVLLAACNSNPTPDVATPIAGATRVAPTAARTAAPVPTATRSVTPSASPTPSEPSGTVIKDDGQNLVLSHPRFYWTLKLPRDWIITYDTGFEVKANNSQQTAFLHLLSQTWLPKDRLPNAKAYVDYWKHYKFGTVFPFYANGAQVSESEISKDKFGGPYLLYEFDDRDSGMRYFEVYASGGGPNSLLMTVWAKSADFDKLKNLMESVLHSVELLKEAK